MTPSIIESLRREHRMRPGSLQASLLVKGESLPAVVRRGNETRRLRQAIYELGIQSETETFWVYEFPLNKKLETGAELFIGEQSWQVAVVTERRVDGELINYVVAATRHAG